MNSQRRFARPLFQLRTRSSSAIIVLKVYDHQLAEGNPPQKVLCSRGKTFGIPFDHVPR
jgi:hypothetical protein